MVSDDYGSFHSQDLFPELSQKAVFLLSHIYVNNVNFPVIFPAIESSIASMTIGTLTEL